MNEALYEVPVRRIDGRATTLDDYRGKVMLIVNVASACGLTPQYAGLEKLYAEKRDDGLVVAGFPANEFREQEPGSNEDIAAFCTSRFGVTFPMFEKIVVKGAEQHPLYKLLTEARPQATEKPGGEFQARLAQHGITKDADADVLWNFEKFLVGRDGTVVGRFAPDVTVDDASLCTAIDEALAVR